MDQPPQTPTSPGLRAIYRIALPLFCVAGVLFLRCSDRFLRPQFWAEDTKVLFIDARALGWVSLLIPYPSYFILAQRGAARLAAYLPALYAPAFYCYAALACTLLTAWTCLRARLDYLMDYRGRVAMALAVVLVPHTGEVFMNLINSQWVLMPVLLVLILQEAPANRREALVDFALLLFAGLSGPFVALYAPWFLLRLRRVTGGRCRYNVLFVSVAWALAGAQVLAQMGHVFPHLPYTRNAHDWTKELGMVFPGSLFFGAVATTGLGRAFYVISPLLLALLGWALWRAESKRRWAALALLGCGLVDYAGGVQKLSVNVLSLTPFGDGARYFYPFYLFALWMGIIFSHDASRGLRTAARVALAMILLSCASRFTADVWPDPGWKHYARRLDAGKEVNGVPVAPGWQVDFPAAPPR